MTRLLILSLALVALSALHLKMPLNLFSRRSLIFQWFLCSLLAGYAVFIIVVGPVAALSVAPLHGRDLTMVTVVGAVQALVLAMQLAILHHTRVAIEAKP